MQPLVTKAGLSHLKGEAKQFQIKVINAVSKDIERSNAPGQGLTLSAPSGVNIGVMEKDLEAMNILWNTLRQAMAEKERKDCFNPEIMDGFQRLHIAILEDCFF